MNTHSSFPPSFLKEEAINFGIPLFLLLLHQSRLTKRLFWLTELRFLGKEEEEEEEEGDASVSRIWKRPYRDLPQLRKKKSAKV